MIAPAPTMSTCKGCGCPIEVKPTGRRREFCGAMACYLKARKPDAKCKTCGKPFRSTRTTGGRGGKAIARTYCSVECKNKGLRVEHRKPCVICGVDFIAKDRRTQACSHVCGRKLAVLAHPTLPPKIKTVCEMMQRMPDNNQAALASWLLSMTPEQLDRVWVQAIIDHLPIGTIAPFANALVAVRDAYRAMLARPQSGR